MTGVEMACQVCRSPLNVINAVYVHPLHRTGTPHEPVPVPAAQLDTIERGPDHLLHLTQAERAQIADGLDRARLYWIDDEFTTITAHASTDLPTLVIDRDLIPV